MKLNGGKTSKRASVSPAFTGKLVTPEVGVLEHK